MTDLDTEGGAAAFAGTTSWCSCWLPDLDMGGLGATRHGGAGRGDRSVVDLDSCDDSLGCAAVLYGRAGVRDLGRRLVLWRVRWWWYPVVLLGPLVFALMVAGIAVMLGEPWDAARRLIDLSIPALGLTLLILALTDGLGEELGWRGYLLPRLLIRHRAFVASLILGLTGGCGTSRRSGLRVARWRANRRGCCSLTFWPSRCFSPMCFWARRAAC